MPRNGTGGYSLPPGINPVVSGTVISSSWANTTLQDIAVALTNSVAKDGQTAMTGNLNMGTNRVRNVADPVDDSDAVNVRYLNSKGLDRLGVSGWERPESGTFPEITQVGDYTVNVPAGTGIVIHPEFGTTKVSWDAEEVVLTNVLSSWATTIAVDASGDIVQLIGNADTSWARSYIILGVVVHPKGEITSILNAPNVLGNVAYGMYDLAMLNRNMVIEGGQIKGNEEDPLSIDMDARRVYYYGGNPNDVDQINFIEYDEITDVRFFPITGNNTVGDSTFDVPVTKYDPNGSGTVTDIPGGTDASTVFRLYEMAGTFFLLYGQHVYNSLEQAVMAIGTEELVMPSNLSNATLVGVIVAKKSTTDLKDTDSTQLVSNPGSGSGGTNVNVDGYVWKTVQLTDDIIIDRSYRNALLWSEEDVTVTVTIRENDGNETLDWRPDDGPVMFLQTGAGKIEVEVEGDDTLIYPEGFLPQTRGVGSAITAFAYDIATGKWGMGGDLLQSLEDPRKLVLQINDRSVLSTSNIATGTMKGNLILPFDFQLDPMSEDGLSASLMVAQASGSALAVDVNVNGTSIIDTKMTFDNTEKTTLTAATKAAYSSAFTAANRVISAGSEISIDVDTVGTAGARGLTVYLKGSRA